MSTFTVKIGVSNLATREYVYTDAIVDTGATYSMFPEEFLRDIQIEPFDWMLNVRLADGSQITQRIGPAYLQLLDREAPCTVAFGSPGIFLIGATALETLGFAADPVNKTLIPAVVQGRPY